MNTLIQTVDSILFFCTSLSAIYLFTFAVAALFKRTDRYPRTSKKARMVLLIPTEDSFDKQEYPEDLYKITAYDDLSQTVKSLQEGAYDVAVILGKGSNVSPLLLEEINRAYQAGVTAIQLHAVADNRTTRRLKWKAIHEEIGNSLFKQGAIRLGVSSTLTGVDMAIDMNWLQKNLKSKKSNLEKRLARQALFVEYLEHIQVHSAEVRIPSYRVKRLKALSALPEAMMTANWDYCHKIVLWLLPSWRTMLVSTAALSLLTLCYDWTSSLKWWGMLFVLLFILCLAIPDYLVEKRKKKK